MPGTRKTKTTETKKQETAPRKDSKRERIETIGAQDRYVMIAEAAYYRAEKRQFAPGDPLLDWLEAEAEVDQILSQGPRKSTRTRAKKTAPRTTHAARGE